MSLLCRTGAPVEGVLLFITTLLFGAILRTRRLSSLRRRTRTVLVRNTRVGRFGHRFTRRGICLRFSGATCFRDRAV